MEHRSGPGEWKYRGRTISVRVDPVRVGLIATTREVVVRVPAVAILAETSRQQVVMIRQYRWAVGATLWELPAGKVDAGEDPASAARRELHEETGYEARHWSLIQEFYPSPGYTDEKIYLYYATDLCKKEAMPEADEDIITVLWTQEQVTRFIQKPEPLNGIAYAGLQWWLRRFVLS